MLNLKDLKVDKAHFLREKYPLFVYKSFKHSISNGAIVINFIFEASEIKFSPQIVINNINDSVFRNLEEGVVNNFIFHLGLIEMLSYWKAFCSPNIRIDAGTLNNNQTNWWLNLIKQSFGEFFYENKINYKEKGFLNIVSRSANKYKKDNFEHKDRYLVLNSGGRDSIVTIEAIKELKKNVATFTLNPTSASKEITRIAAIDQTVIAEREIDNTLLELNKNGYLNGHTPFSAYLAFLSMLSALVFDFKFVISSNERSSNEANTEFLGEKINHQYSKSFEFEKQFREYVKNYISNDIEYISFLRPLYEIQISKIFGKYTKYFNAFKSCNIGQKENKWCGKCPKCLSIYISLFPFMGKNILVKIFKSDLYSKSELKDLLLHLAGKKDPKPFECVGTYEEVKEGLNLSIKKFKEKGEELPYLLKYSKENIFEDYSDPKTLLKEWDLNNFLTREMEIYLKKGFLS